LTKSKEISTFFLQWPHPFKKIAMWCNQWQPGTQHFIIFMGGIHNEYISFKFSSLHFLLETHISMLHSVNCKCFLSPSMVLPVMVVMEIVNRYILVKLNSLIHCQAQLANENIIVHSLQECFVDSKQIHSKNVFSKFRQSFHLIGKRFHCFNNNWNGSQEHKQKHF